MKILIDTHIFLWSLGNTKKLSKERLLELKTQTNIIYVSSISIAELMIKSSIGKLKVDYNPVEMAKESGFELLNFTANDALFLEQLPFHHRDPFDRMLICQGKVNNMRIMTDDIQFNNYDCKLI